jgi:hypothetical protein
MVLQAIDVTAITKRLGGHTIFSPSSSKMWSTCSGSLIPNLYAPDTAGEDAAYGTVAHEVAEGWLREGVRPKHLVGTVKEVVEPSTKFEIEIDNEMLDYVEQYVDWCIYLPGDHFVETRVSISDLTPIDNQGGTADHAACEPGKLTITDLKMGQGIQVYAFENTQALLYAYGFFAKYDSTYNFQKILIRIAQPRLHHFDEWEISRETLLEWADWLKERAYAAWCTDAERQPSADGCLWCKIKSSCAAHAVFAMRLIDGVFDDLTLPITEPDMKKIADELDVGMLTVSPTPIGQLTTAQMASLLPYRKMIESWFKELYEETERRALNGEKVPGYKVVAGRSSREFMAENDVIEHLGLIGIDPENLYKRKLVGLGDVEEQLRKLGYSRKGIPDLLNPIVRKPMGKPTMAPDTDPRRALSSVIDDSFGNLDEEL